MDDKYIRKVQTSVTNFLYFDNEYLFIHRNKNKKIDANRLNGIGGRVEPGENYLDACIRETLEETGYKVTTANIQLAGVAKLEEGYDEDWVMCFFKIKVPSKKIPLGNKNSDGNLVWIDKDSVLSSEYELVDDLNYCFKDIVDDKEIFFLTAKVNAHKKITQTSIAKLIK